MVDDPKNKDVDPCAQDTEVLKQEWHLDAATNQITGSENSAIDFSQGEKKELTSTTVEPFSNLQYLSPSSDFDTKLKALLALTDPDRQKVVYGLIAVDMPAATTGRHLTDSVEKAYFAFENRLIKDLRVPRQYQPPILQENRQKSGLPGNFDCVARKPSSPNEPHTLEFLMYNCSYQEALNRLEGFVRFATEQLKLLMWSGIAQYEGNIDSMKRNASVNLGETAPKRNYLQTVHDRYRNLQLLWRRGITNNRESGPSNGNL